MLLDDVEQLVEPVLGGRAQSTPETKERSAFLKSKRVGSYWYDGARFLYRKGPQGVTVFDTWVWFGEIRRKRAKLAAKFSNSNTFGFPLGPRSGLTILDVDTQDKRVLYEAQSRYGESAFVVQTGGGYHAYYKYSGERRHIRPWGPDTPIDILGGGYAVGAPSVAAKGQYRIIHGTIEDLKKLPPLHVMLDDLRKPIPEGRRNQSLFRMSLEQAVHVDDFESLMDVMRTRNMDCTVPLPDSELEAAARSAWKYEREGKNFVGRGKAVIMSHNTIDRVMAHSPNAFILLTILKRHHWGRCDGEADGLRPRLASP